MAPPLDPLDVAWQGVHACLGPGGGGGTGGCSFGHGATLTSAVTTAYLLLLLLPHMLHGGSRQDNKRPPLLPLPHPPRTLQSQTESRHTPAQLTICVVDRLSLLPHFQTRDDTLSKMREGGSNVAPINTQC